VTITIDENSLVSTQRDLQLCGLNVFSAVPVVSVDPDCWLSAPTVTHGTLLIIGHGGVRFWREAQAQWPETQHPVDDHSVAQSEAVLAEHGGAVGRRCLFPDPHCPLALQRLMRHLGWHAPTPLGLGMHADYGVWSACRAVWWLDAELAAPFELGNPVDHCASCVGRPCISACPASALQVGAMPLLSACADSRLADASACADTCVAREACPIAATHRYEKSQLSYHYGLARSAIHRYRSGGGTP